MGVDICYVISHGFAARMILHSQIIPALRERGVSVALITPNADEPSAIQFAQQYDIRLEKMPTLNAKQVDSYRWVRPYVYEDVRRNPALWAKHQALLARENVPFRSWLKPRLVMGMNRVVGVLPFLKKMAVNWEKRLLADEGMENLLADIDPKLVVATYPVAAVEGSALLAAENAGIPTVGHLLSWDNITAKGRLAVVPQRFITWGPIMTEELEAHYDVPVSAVIEAGVAHFDAHISAVDPDCVRDILLDLGLNAEKPYLFFGMSSPIFAPHEIDVVEWLAKAVDDDRFGSDMQLVIRPHPQNVSGYMADQSWLPRLRAIASDRVAVDYPILKESSLMWNMDIRDLSKLSNLLAGCVVSLNSGSTLSIDAIIHDKPVILTMFDADNDTLPLWQSARRLADYTHLAKMMALGGTRQVSSFAELEAAVIAYLQNPQLDASGRANVRQQEVGICDGQASLRVADALGHYLEN